MISGTEGTNHHHTSLTARAGQRKEPGMSEQQQAADRLRKMESTKTYYEAAVIYGTSNPLDQLICKHTDAAIAKDRATCLAAYLRELDPTPVDDEFARSVSSDGKCVQVDHRMNRIYSIGEQDKVALLSYYHGRWRFQAVNSTIYIKTIGQFYTACRLHGVQLKEGATTNV